MNLTGGKDSICWEKWMILSSVTWLTSYNLEKERLQYRVITQPYRSV